MNQLLAGCARATIDPGFSQQLSQQVSRYNHKRVMRLMWENGIQPKTQRRIWAGVTDSNHDQHHCSSDVITRVGDRQTIYPLVSGQTWISDTHQYILDPTDPWPEGYKFSDTWPMLK